jgi:catechol 2,3-dioxygenase-like lactoylglutathione lyase family enzyme
MCQVAISTLDLARAHQWYRQCLGLQTAGDRRHREGDSYAAVPGLPEASFDVWCLVDRQEFFQLELFEFAKPRMRTMRADWRCSDIGYSSVGIHVEDFEGALGRAQSTSGELLTEPIGPAGRRRVCLRDPDGILLELMEDDVRGRRADAASDVSVPAAIRSVTLSVRDLEKARRFWVDTLGLTEAGNSAIHGEEHESLWGLADASREKLVAWAGDVAVELVQYERPVGRARPSGYLISDQGILNVALGCTDKGRFEAAYERVVSGGYRVAAPPWALKGVATVVYAYDDQGFCVELLHVEPEALERMGFRAGGATENRSRGQVR